jgi:type II secretory pathway pseudopilin PulG
MHLIAIVEHSRSSRRQERGYVLLTLLLAMSMLIIAAGIGASSIAFSIRRDREEELIHRGVQYSRAIREFTKKTGRFPIRLEELDDTNGRRFLRKHYKDPLTGKDFKLLHMADIQLQGSAPLVSNANGNGDAGAGDVVGDKSTDPAPASTPTQTDPNGNAAGAASSQPSGQLPVRGGANPGVAIPASSGQPLSGGLIVGVVSASKDQSIREFDRKRHYNEWWFYYDTSVDRNFLLNAPTQKPTLQQMAMPGAASLPVPGQPFSQPSQPGIAPSGSAPQ